MKDQDSQEAGARRDIEALEESERWWMIWFLSEELDRRWYKHLEKENFRKFSETFNSSPIAAWIGSRNVRIAPSGSGNVPQNSDLQHLLTHQGSEPQRHLLQQRSHEPLQNKQSQVREPSLPLRFLCHQGSLSTTVPIKCIGRLPQQSSGGPSVNSGENDPGSSEEETEKDCVHSTSAK